MLNKVTFLLVLLCSLQCLAFPHKKSHKSPKNFARFLLGSPREFVCPGEGFYPGEVYCSESYYYCTENGYASLQTCPPGNVFDPSQPNGAACVSPEQAICATVTITPTSAPAPFVCPDEGFFPTGVPCSENYYYCTGEAGNSYLQTCPSGNVYDPTQEACVSPDKCNEITTITSTSTSTTTDFPFICPSMEGSFPISGTCGSNYYDCNEGVPSLETCPAGYVFDPVTLICTLSDQASCNQPFDCPNDGMFPYPDACTSFYYVCSAGQSTTEYCPENWVFDPETLKCETIEDASCTVGPYTTTTTFTSTTTVSTTLTSTTESATSTSTTESTTSISSTDKTTSTSMTTTATYTNSPCGTSTPSPSNFTCPNSTGLYAYANCSSLYWSCSNSVPYLLCCPSTLVFNEAKKTCDYPAVVGCSNSVVRNNEEIQNNMDNSPRDNLIGTDSDFECPSYGLHPHPLYCNWYYSCYYEEPPYIWECTGAFLFDVINEKCNNPELTVCGNRTLQNSVTEMTTLTKLSSPFVCPTSNGFFPLSSIACSSSYYSCIRNAAFFQTCPGKTLFDPSVSACVSTDQANCTN